MRSLKRIFSRIRGENPYWSDYTALLRLFVERDFLERLSSATSTF
jgi:hypothetical protein